MTVPAGRGRWRFTLHSRQFASGTTYQQNIITELTAARGRRLELAWNTPARATFTIDGHHSQAAQVAELATDVMCWRWDDATNADKCMFKGIVTQSEDQLDTDSHSVTFTCQDYAAMLSRRLLTATYAVTGLDQDFIVADLVTRATTTSSSSGTSLSPGAYLPLGPVQYMNPDGSGRAVSGRTRDRTYFPQTNIGEAFDALSKVINGFDYDINYLTDRLRIWYPYQGVTRTDVELQYGNQVAGLTRSVNSADYSNYWRAVGNNGSSDPNAAQLYSEAWNNDANNVTVVSYGLWMGDDNSTADVTLLATLADKVNGDLALWGNIVAAYTLTMRPGAYRYGYPNMGDVVPLIVNAGRLHVNTTVRVLGIGFDISDDAAEDVTLTVGRPSRTLADLFAQADASLGALTRR